jgi:hypothetical protein
MIRRLEDILYADKIPRGLLKLGEWSGVKFIWIEKTAQRFLSGELVLKLQTAGAVGTNPISI